MQLKEKYYNIQKLENLLVARISGGMGEYTVKNMIVILIANKEGVGELHPNNIVRNLLINEPSLIGSLGDETKHELQVQYNTNLITFRVSEDNLEGKKMVWDHTINEFFPDGEETKLYTLSELPFTDKDIENWQATCERLGIHLFIIKDKDERDLRAELNNIRLLLLGDMYVSIDTVLLAYTGHGYFNYDNNIAGIFTKEDEKINLTEIINYYSEVKTLWCIFDGCRSEKTDITRNKTAIRNEYSMLLFPTAKGVPARGNSTVGGFFTYNFLQQFESLEGKQYINHENIYYRSDNAMMQYYLFLNDKYGDQPDKRDRITKPKIYANLKMRNVDIDHYYRMLEFTGQSIESARVTATNELII